MSQSSHPRVGRRRPFFAALSILSVFAMSCQDTDTPALGGAVAASGEAAPAPLPEVLARIGDTAITLADLEPWIGDQLSRLKHAFAKDRHELVHGALGELLRERIFGAEAAERGLTVAELIARELESVAVVTTEDAEAWYRENRARIPGRSLDEVRGQILDFLRGQRREEALEALQTRLGGARGAKDVLGPFRVALANDGAPFTGLEDATVTLVEFSDFECPFCKQLLPTLKRVMEDYGDRVRLVYRQLPLTNLHPSAFKAAEASLCADEQGMFWEMHDLMFEEQSRLSVRDLKEKAGRLGLDRGVFDACLDTGRHVARVQTDVAEAVSIGLTGTPALFVNGIQIPGGAVPFGTITEAIDEELARIRLGRGG